MDPEHKHWTHLYCHQLSLPKHFTEIYYIHGTSKKPLGWCCPRMEKMKSTERQVVTVNSTMLSPCLLFWTLCWFSVTPLLDHTSRAKLCFLFCLGQKLFINAKKLEDILIRNTGALWNPVSLPQQWLMPHGQGKEINLIKPIRNKYLIWPKSNKKTPFFLMPTGPKSWFVYASHYLCIYGCKCY